MLYKFWKTKQNLWNLVIDFALYYAIRGQISKKVEFDWRTRKAIGYVTLDSKVEHKNWAQRNDDLGKTFFLVMFKWAKNHGKQVSSPATERIQRKKESKCVNCRSNLYTSALQLWNHADFTWLHYHHIEITGIKICGLLWPLKWHQLVVAPIPLFKTIIRYMLNRIFVTF